MWGEYRSHILEVATYEEYEIVSADEYDEYVEEFEDETGEEEVELRYRLLDRPTVMCHSYGFRSVKANANTCWRISKNGSPLLSTTHRTSRSSSHAGSTISLTMSKTMGRRRFVHSVRH